jgi:hypothetical protein
MSNASEAPNPTPAKIVYNAMIRAHQARSEMWQAKLMNAVTDGHRARLQSATLDYYDELRRYRSQVEDEWQAASPWAGGLDVLPQLAAKTRTETIEEVSGGINRTRVVETPYQIDPDHLIMTLYDLDDIAADLGFEAATREQLIEDEITMEQIESVFGRPQDGSTVEAEVADGEK